MQIAEDTSREPQIGTDNPIWSVTFPFAEDLRYLQDLRTSAACSRSAIWCGDTNRRVPSVGRTCQMVVPFWARDFPGRIQLAKAAAFVVPRASRAAEVTVVHVSSALYSVGMCIYLNRLIYQPFYLIRYL